MPALPPHLQALLANFGAPPGPAASPGLTVPSSAVTGTPPVNMHSGSVQADASPMDIDGGSYQASGFPNYHAKFPPCNQHALSACPALHSTV